MRQAAPMTAPRHRRRLCSPCLWGRERSSAASLREGWFSCSMASEGVHRRSRLAPPSSRSMKSFRRSLQAGSFEDARADGLEVPGPGDGGAEAPDRRRPEVTRPDAGVPGHDRHPQLLDHARLRGSFGIPDLTYFFCLPDIVDSGIPSRRGSRSAPGPERTRLPGDPPGHRRRPLPSGPAARRGGHRPACRGLPDTRAPGAAPA